MLVTTTIETADVELPASTASPAANLKARFQDAASGSLITTWRASLRSLGSSSDVARLLAERPIGENAQALDFGSLPPGRWVLSVRSNNDGAYANKSIPAFSAGDVVDLGVVFFSRQAGIHVKLMFPDGLPSSDLSLSAYEMLTGGQRGRLEVKRDLEPKLEQMVKFEALAAESILLVAEAPSSGLFSQKAVELVGGGIVEIDLPLSPIQVRGTVLRGDGPIAGAKVQLARGGRVRTRGTSDESGSYQLRTWEPGRYLVVTELSDTPSPSFETIEIPDDSTSFDHDVLLPSNRIFGVVSDADTGQPVGGAEVAFEYRTGSGATSLRSTFVVNSNALGMYEGTNLRSVPVDLTVMADHYSTAEIKGVMPSESGQQVDVKLERGDSLRGRVVDEVGNPVAEAAIGVDTDGDDYLQTGSTDGSGQFEFRNLLTGPHTLVVEKCGFELVPQVATVASSTEAQVPPTDSTVTIALTSRVHPLTVHIDRRGSPAANVGLWFEINGLRLPRAAVVRFARRCGFPIVSDSVGDLRLDYLPEGPLRAFAYDGSPVGSFAHDASNSVWRISLP